MNEIRRMQQLAGILNENKDTVDIILDKITQHGMDSLTYAEKEYLNKYSKDDKNLEEPYNLTKSEFLYSPEVISQVEKLLPSQSSNNVKSPKLKPLSIEAQEVIDELPERIKNLFPLKKGDYQKLDTFMEVLTDKITGGEQFYSYISTFLGNTALESWEQNLSALMLSYLNQNKFTTPEITSQYHTALVDRFIG